MAGEEHSPDPVDIHSLAYQIRRQKEGSAEREAYLQDLKKKIERGEYETDAAEIARKIVDEALADSESSARTETRHGQPDCPD